ncbi:glycoside hydrolase family 97 protein [Dysgonomonas sp. 216]|uniref:glycoside hydrolase family 97 protein n=1 Tax=Dysgonomonas sp. 216 TaxID=2302934 RepID=UPI0013CF524B|nr:glycoside hydrolase family 97 protein [Dysgonomonas sp. 216]NDW19313.1 glycoside hydrolase family 97 protein [Dysgonomonas sp. 216]
MKKILIALLLIGFLPYTQAQNSVIKSPDQNLSVELSLKNGIPNYAVTYKGKQILEDSPLGLKTNVGDFSKDLSFVDIKLSDIEKSYTQNRIKKSDIHYVAKEAVCTYENTQKQKIFITIRVSNNNIALKYALPQFGETACCIIEKEATGFKFPQFTTTFLTPQATPMIGWKRTKPSYEEEYVADEPIGTPSKYGVGYTFPGLFHVGDNGWALVSETGVSSLYCGSKLSEGTKDGLYTVAFPEEGENNGIGNAQPAIALPGETPWRTITVGDNLKPIVETTIPFDVVEPLYEPSTDYKFGRSTWSWIMWQDNSVNYDDQIKYIDLAAAMGYEYVLIDGLWDKQIGYDRMPSLFKYAQSKGVDVFLWYNSNGYWNDAPQGAKQKMSNSVARKKEMKWLQSLGVKGLKVDFFGGDKQETMKLYEDILSDANEYGLMIIFHGCTLPRGWERMYPNYVGSEAVLASENLIFTQHANDTEAYNASLHPFIRNAVGAMEFGPVLLNKRHNKTNDGGQTRKTTDIFQIATAVLFQSPVQMFAIAPNNLTDCADFVIDFMKKVPTTWDETVFIDGYPGKYCVLARRHNNEWYVVGINAQKEPLKLKVNLPMLTSSKVAIYSDTKDRKPQLEEKSIKNNKEVSLLIQPEGGIILTNK